MSAMIQIHVRSSLLVVSHKPKFIELMKAVEHRKYGREYGNPGSEDDMVWIIPSIDDLGSREGSYTHYINRLKPPILKYELDNYGIGKEDLGGEITDNTFEELLELRVFARMFPIEMLLGRIQNK